MVPCPRCGHQNRATVVVTLCDRCGEDISSATQAEQAPRLPPPQEDVGPEAEPAPAGREPTAAGEPDASPGFGRRALSVLGRLALAGLATGVGVFGSQKIHIGTALSADRYIAGSVAILACAAGMIGLVLVLVGSSPHRSQSVSVGCRLLGFALASSGTLVAVALVLQGGQEEFPPPMPDDMLEMMPPDGVMGEPFPGPEIGEPGGPPPGPEGSGGEGFERPFIPGPVPEGGPQPSEPPP
jgi:hypothetical protein